jgi:hypothetical protein
MNVVSDAFVSVCWRLYIDLLDVSFVQETNHLYRTCFWICDLASSRADLGVDARGRGCLERAAIAGLCFFRHHGCRRLYTTAEDEGKRKEELDEFRLHCLYGWCLKGKMQDWLVAKKRASDQVSSFHANYTMIHVIQSIKIPHNQHSSVPLRQGHSDY